MANQEVDYVQLLKESFETGAKSQNLVPLLVASVVASLSMITIVLWPPFHFGLARMALKVARGERVEAGEVWPGMDHAIKAIILFLIIGVGVTIGSMLLIIPGLLFGFFTGLAPFIMASEDTSAIDALKRSFEMVKSNWVIVLIGMLITGLVIGVGSVVPLVGTILLTPFGILFMAKVYGHVRALPSGAASGQLHSGG